MSKKALFYTICPLYLFLYMGDAFLTSYYSLYFLDRGMDETQCALLLGVAPFALFVGCLVLGALAKTRKRTLILFRFAMFLEAGLLLVFSFCQQFWSLLLLLMLLQFCNGAPFSLIEGYVVPLIELRGGHYSTVRLFGSLGYILSLVAGFFLLKNIPIQHCFYFSFAFLLLAFGLSFLLRDDPGLAERKVTQEEPVAPKGTIWKRGTVFFWLSQLFCYGTYNASMYLLPIRLRELGFADSDYSLARAIAVGVELVILLAIPLFGQRFRQKKIPLFLAGTFIVLATLSGAFLTNPFALAYVNLCVGHIGKAFLFGFQALLLEEIVGKQLLGKALTVNVGAVNITAASLNFSSAAISAAWGYPGFFLLMSALEGIGVGMLAFIPSQNFAETEAK